MPDKQSRNGRPDNFAAAVTEVSERMSVLVREEIELAKAEVSQKANSIIRGAVAIAAGAVFGVFAVVFGLATAAWGLNSLLNSLWLGFVIVFAVLLVLTVATFMFARKKLKVGAPTPDMAIDEAKKIRETVTATANGQTSPTQLTAEGETKPAKVEQAEKADDKAEKGKADGKAEKADGKAEKADGKAEKVEVEKAEGDAEPAKAEADS